MLRVSQLAALAMLAVVPCVAAAQELFGAIAYSEKAQKYGWANNYPTRDDATKAALEFCAKNGPDCRVVLWFRNACGALVTGPTATAPPGPRTASRDQQGDEALRRALGGVQADAQLLYRQLASVLYRLHLAARRRAEHRLERRDVGDHLVLRHRVRRALGRRIRERLEVGEHGLCRGKRGH